MNKDNIKKYLKYLPFMILICLASFIFVSAFDYKDDGYLKVVFLDVSQGDSIFIETPNKKQILIDGGPDSKVLSSLSKVMPFADRSLDMIIVTHEDKDHIGGVPLIMDNYDVEYFLTTTKNNSKSSLDLKDKFKSKNIKEIIIKNKKRILLDKDIYLDIIYPNKDVSDLETNESSIVCKLVYKNNSFMFMGDANLYVENVLLWEESIDVIDADILKLGHHGSKSSSSLLWLEKVSPDFAIISAGKDNSYGHPNKEVLDRLDKLKIPYLITYDMGNIMFRSDGQNITL